MVSRRHLVCLGLAASCDQQPGRSDSTVVTAWSPVAVNDLNGDGMVDFALFLSPDPVGPDFDYKLAFDSSFIEKAHAALGI